MRLSFLLLCTMVLPAAASPAFAGAWTQASGQGIAILSGSEYSTSSYFDNAGQKQSEPRYRKYELNPYLEYGIADGLTAGANLSLQYASQSPNTHAGIGDSEFFLRKRLWQQDGFTLSAEPMIKLPSPESAHTLPALGSTHPDAGLGLNAGYGFSAFGRTHFIDVDTQYRNRFGPPKNQARLNATLGIGLTPQWMILPQLFITRRTQSPRTAAFTQSSGDDYNLTKLQLSAVYKLTSSISLQAGGFLCADGKNTGAGNGLLLAAWKTF